jgi:hypothetical protein
MVVVVIHIVARMIASAGLHQQVFAEILFGPLGKPAQLAKRLRQICVILLLYVAAQVIC